MRKPTFSDFCKIVYCPNENKTSTIIYHSMQDFTGYKVAYKTLKKLISKFEEMMIDLAPLPIKNDFSLRLALSV